MKRITILMATLATGFVTLGKADAQNVRTIESRIMSMEARLAELESKLAAAKGEKPAPTPALAPAVSAPAKKVANETYVIRDGDSLGGIARKFGIPRQALLDSNNMAEGQPIYIGESLIIPSAPVNETSVASATSGEFHIVQAGDTLTGISRKYGTTVAAIKKQNGLNSDIIGAGQKLMLPVSGEAPKQDIVQAAQNTTPSASGSGSYQYENPLLKSDETYGYYSVQKGDNLYALARDFFTTMKELQRLNNMGTSTVIHPGDEMVVPTSKYNDYHQNVAQN
ncbi:MAG: LysM peptidoglycan-binding domain-containing protein [Verrucomicrobiales bacterium]|nr:LysM peptidoglycan-binding domain-containing protein [Verrucomicrobiales bacterium]